MTQRFAYSVKYRRDPLSRRVHRMTVDAANADEARLIVKAHDPLFTSTIETPRRRGESKVTA